MAKFRLLIGIFIAAMFAVTAVQAAGSHRAKAAHGKKATEKCQPYGDADLPQMCSVKK